MFCHNCGNQIPDGTNFCHYCGAAQSAPTAVTPQPVQQAQPQPQPAAYQPAQVQAQQITYPAPQQVQAQQATYQAQQPTYQPPQPGAYQPQQAAYQPPAPQPPAAPQERVFAGIMGALLGSAVGVILMLILFSMNYISSLTGGIMLACAAWGYAHFGKVLNKRGIVLSVLVVIVMIYIGNALCWSNVYFTEATYEFYYESLAKQYLFAAIGVVFLLINLSRGNRAAKK